jgi:iron complex outermembrane receptor protein
LIGAGFNSAINHSNGSGVNLRGLGNTATLVLIDGNRMAPTAQGGFVDISEIPLAAVDHVEVLTDGSSAIYGSDAIGGVVNFVLSKDFDGLEVRGRADAIDGMNGGRGAITWGTKWNSGNAIVSGQYLEHGELSTGERDFSSAAPQPTSITPSRQTSNVVARVTENIAPAVSVYFDGLYTNSHSKFDYSDGYGGTYFASPIHQYGQGSAGVSANLASDWAISANTSYSRDYTVFHGHDMPVGYFGGLDITDDYRLFLINAKADGTLFVVPGGNVRAAVGVDYRQENFTLLIPSNELDSKFARDVDSVFAEVYVPIVSAQNALPLVQSLKFSAAIRFDRYTDFGDTTNPKFGVSWQPISDLRLRASYSTSFRAPTGFEEIVANPQSVVLFTADLPAPSGVGTVPSLIWNGSVTNLKPETARSFTVGGTYTPSWDRTLSLEANYYDVDYRNRIENPPFVQGALQQLSIYGPLVAPLANDAAAQALINSVQSSGGRFLDFANTGGVGLQYLYDIRQRNVAVVDIAGVDLAATQTFEDGPNLFRLSVNTTFMHHYLTSFGAASTDVANTPSNPLRFRGRFEAGWTRGGWSVTAALNHSNAYKNNLVVPSVPVNAYDTLDVNVHYNLDDLVWRGASINAGLLNAFDRNPPALQATNLLYPVGFDQANGDPYGRQIYVEIVKRW